LPEGARRIPPLDLSAVAHRGVSEVLRAALDEVERARAAEKAETEAVAAL